MYNPSPETGLLRHSKPKLRGGRGEQITMKVKPFLLGLTVSTITNVNADILGPLAITVYGDKLDTVSYESLPIRSSISKQQIAASGAQSLTDVLRSSGLVTIGASYTGNDSDNSISMGGFGENASQNLVILLNGQRLNFATLETVDLGLIPIESVSQIDIIEGSAGVLFGEGAVGGVINIRTVTTGLAETQAGLTLDTNHLFSSTFSTIQPLAKNIEIGTSLATKTSDNTRDNSESELTNGSIRISYLGNKDKLTLMYNRSVQDQRLPGSLPLPYTVDRTSTQTPNDFSKTQRNLTTLSYVRDLGEQSGSVEADLSYQVSRGKSFYDDYYTPNGYDPYTGYQTSKQRLASVRWLDKTSLGNLIVGAEESLSTFDNGTQKEQTVRSLFLQNSLDVSDSLNLTVGSRSSWHQNDSIAGKSPKGYTNSLESTLTYTVAEDISVYGRFAESFRLASIDELNRTVPAELEPQTSSSKTLGTKVAFEKAELKLEYTETNYKNEIYYDPSVTFDPSATPNWWAYGANVNLPTSKRQQLKASYSGELSPTVRIGATLKQQFAKNTSGSYAGRHIPLVPEHTASFFLFNRLPDGYSLYTDASYTGSMYVSGDNLNTSSKSDPYWLINTTLTWENGPFSVKSGIKNLLDTDYNAFAGATYAYPGPGRSAFVSLGYTF